MSRFDLTRTVLEIATRDLASFLADPNHHALILAILYLSAALLGHHFSRLVYVALSAAHAAGFAAHALAS